MTSTIPVRRPSAIGWPAEIEPPTPDIKGTEAPIGWIDTGAVGESPPEDGSSSEDDTVTDEP
ncbi:MAG TPA: hypothetical protein VFR35_09980, partial [Actinoplanes sp.]|nr:hypothetical protein [Actinoplanes sp.]